MTPEWRVKELRTELATMRGFIRMALDELGVPNADYPAPISNTVKILNDALHSFDQSQSEEGKA